MEPLVGREQGRLRRSTADSVGSSGRIEEDHRKMIGDAGESLFSYFVIWFSAEICLE